MFLCIMDRSQYADNDGHAPAEIPAVGWAGRMAWYFVRYPSFVKWFIDKDENFDSVISVTRQHL